MTYTCQFQLISNEIHYEFRMYCSIMQTCTISWRLHKMIGYNELMRLSGAIIENDLWQYFLLADFSNTDFIREIMSVVSATQSQAEYNSKSVSIKSYAMRWCTIVFSVNKNANCCHDWPRLIIVFQTNLYYSQNLSTVYNAK